DHIVVEHLANFMGSRNSVLRFHQGGFVLLANDIHAQLDAFIADEHRRPGDEFADFVLALPTEGAIERILAIATAGLAHRTSSNNSAPPVRPLADRTHFAP